MIRATSAIHAAPDTRPTERMPVAQLTELAQLASLAPPPRTLRAHDVELDEGAIMDLELDWSES